MLKLSQSLFLKVKQAKFFSSSCKMGSPFSDVPHSTFFLSVPFWMFLLPAKFSENYCMDDLWLGYSHNTEPFQRSSEMTMTELRNSQASPFPSSSLELAPYFLNTSVLHSATEKILLLIFLTLARGPGVLRGCGDWYCLLFPGRFSFFSSIHYY